LITYTPKQEALIDIIKNKTHILSPGGSRAGKTFCFTRSIWNRALAAPRSWHLILRQTYRAVKASMFKQTFHDLKQLEPERWEGVELMKSDITANFPNGSRVICGGLDDDHIDSILGNEYCTIYFNECSEITYDVVETALTRLAQVCEYDYNGTKRTLNLKAFYDCNPPSLRHWTHKVFFEGVKPDNTKIRDFDDYGVLKINPIDNKDNLPDQYFKILDGFTGKKRQRFVEGEFTDDTEGALFKQEWIDAARCKWNIETNKYDLPELDKIVIAVDPAVSTEKDSDDTGIVVCGSNVIDGYRHYYIIRDVTGKYTPKEWADKVIALYKNYEANLVVAEKNQGGDLVERNIHAEDNNVPVKLVHATKGKAMRAEPVSNLAERGYIHFYGSLVDLENELTSWVPDSGMQSPNRLDAMVWGVTDLMGGGVVTEELHSEYDASWYVKDRKGIMG
jgi:PBSX family phage terminase large subunit